MMTWRQNALLLQELKRSHRLRIQLETSWEEESAIISPDGANGNKAILTSVHLPNGTSLNN
jgi:hypothetical protein